MDLAARAQILQPGGEQLIHFFLGQNLADFSRDLRQGHILAAGTMQLGQECVAIIGLDAGGVDLDCRTEPGLDLTKD